MRIKAVFNRTDKRQKKYIKYLEKVFPQIINEQNPDMYYVVGGDGSMMYAHKNYGHHGKPFFGKGIGTLNFIMHNIDNDYEIITGLLNNKLVEKAVAGRFFEKKPAAASFMLLPYRRPIRLKSSVLK